MDLIILHVYRFLCYLFKLLLIACRYCCAVIRMIICIWIFRNLLQIILGNVWEDFVPHVLQKFVLIQKLSLTQFNALFPCQPFRNYGLIQFAIFLFNLLTVHLKRLHHTLKFCLVLVCASMNTQIITYETLNKLHTW